MNNAFLPVKVPLSLVHSCVPFSAEIGADRALEVALSVILGKLWQFDDLTWMSYWLRFKGEPLPDFQDAGSEAMVRIPMKRRQLKALQGRAGVWFCSTDHLLSWFIWRIMTEGKAG